MLERLPDPGDAASIQESRFSDAAVAGIQSKLKPQRHPDFDGESCLDCAATMPEARLKDGRIRCTGCETALEMKAKQYR